MRCTAPIAFLVTALLALAARADEASVNPDIFVGAPLLTNEEKYELTKAPRFQFQQSDLFVIAPSAIKPSAAWTDAERAACTASGGEIVEITAGRSACLNF